MEKSPTMKALNQLVDNLNDKRFNPELFGIWIASQNDQFILRDFSLIILSYLRELSQDHIFGMGRLADDLIESKTAYEMMKVYHSRQGGYLEDSHLDLDTLTKSFSV